MVTAAQMDFSTMSMGQIHQFTLEVVDKLCRQHQYFSDIMNRKAKYTRACRKPYLEIKCREKACHCSPKKKKAIQTQTMEKRRPLKFFRRSQRRGRRIDVSSIRAYRPRIFFINGFLCFLEDECQRNGEEEELRGDATSRRKWGKKKLTTIGSRG